jgi:FkbM family methyltransferase
MLPDIEIVQGTYDRFLCFKTDDFVSRLIRAHGVWGESESCLAILMCEGFSSPLVLDVGANLGGFTVPVAKKLSQSGGILHAFEPQRIVFQQLCGNVILNRLDNVFAHNVALGSETKKIEIPRIDYHKTQNIGAVSLIPEIQKVTKVAYSDTSSEEVHVTSIDSLAPRGRCAFVKIDVEGFESEVIKGGVVFLEENAFPPVLFEEWRKGKFSGAAGESVEQRQAQAREALANLGYQLVSLEANLLLAQHPKGHAEVVLMKQFDHSTRIVRVR